MSPDCCGDVCIVRVTDRDDSPAQTSVPLFRRQAIRSAEYSWFGPVRLVTPPGWRLSILTAFVSMALLIAAATLAEIPDRVRATGMLLPKDGLFKVRAPRAGTVEVLFIRNGEHVDVGSPLLRISGAQSAPGERPEIESRIVSLRRELLAKDRATDSEIDAARARLRRNRERQEIIDQQIIALDAELAAYQSASAVFDKRARRLEKLAMSDAIAKQLVDEARLSALQATATTQSARQRRFELEEKRLLVELQLEDDQSRIRILRDRASATAESIARQIDAGRLDSSVEIVAGRKGSVSGLTISPGQFVRGGDVLATLHNPRSALEARLYLSSGNAGRIAVGQRVELAVQAYPREIHGTLTAIVQSISPAAIPASEIAPGTVLSGPVFELRARLVDPAIDTHGRRWELLAGTSVSAHIIRQRWPLYRWLFRTVTRV